MGSLRRVVRAIFAATLLTAGNAYAYIGCTEKVTSIIVHSDGAIYFTTSQTCTNGWCTLGWSSPSMISAAYALMLTAETQGLPLTFAWDNVPNCSTANATYASPDFVFLAPPQT